MGEDDWTSPNAEPLAVFLNGHGHHRARAARRADRRRLVPDPASTQPRGRRDDAARRARYGATWERRARHRPTRTPTGERDGAARSTRSARARSSCSGMPDGRALSSTYRLQLHAGFGFARRRGDRPVPRAARRLAPLPLADPAGRARLDARLRRRRPHARLGRARRARRASRRSPRPRTRTGSGSSSTSCPNHMAIPEPEHLNRPLWEMLRLGRDAPTAHWFDIDWDARRRPHRPAGARRAARGGARRGRAHASASTTASRCCAYFDHRFPLAPGSDAERRRATLLAQQHYLLAVWRDKDDVLNYRRFFDVDTLIAVRVELDDVFDATHAVLLDLHRAGRRSTASGSTTPTASPTRRATSSGCATRPAARGSSSRRSSRPASSCRRRGRAPARRATTRCARSRPRSCRRSATELDERWRATGGEPSLERVEIEAKGLVVRNLFEPEVARLARARRRSGRATASSTPDVVRRGAARAARRTSRSTAPTCGPGTRRTRTSSRALERDARRWREHSRPDLADALATLVGAARRHDGDERRRPRPRRALPAGLRAR